MPHASRFGWLAMILALIAGLVLAGTAAGGVPASDFPGSENAEIYPPQPLALSAATTHLALAPQSMHLAPGEEAWLYVVIQDVTNLNWLEFVIAYDLAKISIEPVGWPFELLGCPNRDYVIGNQDFFGEAYLGVVSVTGTCSGTHNVARVRIKSLSSEPSELILIRTYMTAIGSGGTTVISHTRGTCSINPPPPTATPSPTSTPTATPTRGQRMVHGSVTASSGTEIPGAQLTLYRDAGGWTQQASGPSGSDGVFRLYTNPIAANYKLVVQPPAGYAATSAGLPDGVAGQVDSADTLVFALDSSPGEVGAFGFVVDPLPTAAPTYTPQPTLPPVVLQGRVSLGGAGLAGVEVSLDLLGLGALQMDTTDAEGRYSLVAGPGVYTLSIHDPSGRVMDQSRTVDTDVWEPGPIDWDHWQGWLPLLRRGKD